jgi:Uma2 family endonuclease
VTLTSVHDIQVTRAAGLCGCPFFLDVRIVLTFPHEIRTEHQRMAEVAEKLMTVAEFLEFDDGTDTRYELVGGQPSAMSPPTERHTQIASAIAGVLFSRLRPPCRPYLAGGVSKSDEDRVWRVPDIFVSCVDGSGYSREPRFIVEILSPSTEKDDRTAKLDFYKTFASLQTVLFVWQDTRRVELHERSADAWIVRDRIGSGTVQLADLGIALTMDEIYAA